jgi:CheY-like chemotaxis protein
MKVLLVEDEANARDVYSRLLECDGHDVVAVGGAEAAMAAIDAQAFDAALIDIALGELDGYAVLGHLKRHQPGVRAVVMTAYDVPDASRRPGAAAADAFLAKPLRWSEARAAIAPPPRECPHP